MKKISAFFLALALCLGLAVSAFAADENTSLEITLQGPENSGILMESKTETYSVVGFVRSTDGAAVAYMHGEEWLEQLLDYIKGNIDFTENYLREHIPGIGMIRPQASYLIYLDCRGLGLTQEELVRLFVDKSHLALNDGTMFGEPGRGFMRLNIGCPRSVLEQALKQLEAAVAGR